MMTQNVIVISASHYSFTDEATKRLNEGCTVRYITTDNLSPREDVNKTSKGYKPAKATLPVETYHKMPEIPGVYEATLIMDTNSKGDTTVKPIEFKFLSVLVNKAPTAGKMNFNTKQEQ
jgi:hypothetical protein